MNAPLGPTEKEGDLEITGGIRHEGKALALKAALEDLPGVHDTEIIRNAIRVRFDPELVSEQQMYEAVKIAGYHASDLIIAHAA